MNIGYSGDQDWFSVQLASCGTMTLTLSNLIQDYDLRLFGGGCPAAQIDISQIMALLTNKLLSRTLSPSL